MDQIMSVAELRALLCVLNDIEADYSGTSRDGHPKRGLCREISDRAKQYGVTIPARRGALFHYAGYDSEFYPVPMPEEFEEDYLAELDSRAARLCNPGDYTRNEWAYDNLDAHIWDVNHPYGQARWKFVDDVREAARRLLKQYA